MAATCKASTAQVALQHKHAPTGHSVDTLLLLLPLDSCLSTCIHTLKVRTSHLRVMCLRWVCDAAVRSLPRTSLRPTLTLRHSFDVRLTCVLRHLGGRAAVPDNGGAPWAGPLAHVNMCGRVGVTTAIKARVEAGGGGCGCHPTSCCRRFRACNRCCAGFGRSSCGAS